MTERLARLCEVIAGIAARLGAGRRDPAAPSVPFCVFYGRATFMFHLPEPPPPAASAGRSGAASD